MQVFHDDYEVVVAISVEELQNFADTWPASGMEEADEELIVVFDQKGNLIDVTGEAPSYDPGAVSAIIEDAHTFAARRLKLDW